MYILDTNTETFNTQNNSVIDEKEDDADNGQKIQEPLQRKQQSTVAIVILALLLGIVALALILALVKIK